MPTANSAFSGLRRYFRPLLFKIIINHIIKHTKLTKAAINDALYKKEEISRANITELLILSMSETSDFIFSPIVLTPAILAKKIIADTGISMFIAVLTLFFT